MTAVPRIVGSEEWLRELETLREREKVLTRQFGALSAQRRRLPMVEITKPYRLESENGSVSLGELFDGRNQLIATRRRGVEHLGSHWTYLDLTPYGRQETWEDSPDGWPQTEPYGWMRRHDEYER